jgi:LysM repeat protein
MSPALRLRRLVVIPLLAAVVLGGLAAPTPAGAQGCNPFHIVQPGENLFRIGLRYNLAWTVLRDYNRLTNPNRVLVGQVICLPTGGTPANPVPNPTPNPNPVPTNPYYPPPGVFPRIDFNTRAAGAGDTITITGIQFPGNATVDIYIAPLRTPYPSTPQASATTAADGTLNTAFSIPDSVEGRPLRGGSLSVIVVARASRYYGFNYFTNTRP